MKRSLILVVLLLARVLQASNPDASGQVSVSYGQAVVNPSLRLTNFNYELHQSTTFDNSYGIELNLPVADLATLGLSVGRGHLEGLSEFALQQSSPSWSRTKSMADINFYSGGLRLYPASLWHASFDFGHAQNPMGPLGWPIFDVAFHETQGASRTIDQGADGQYNASSMDEMFYDTSQNVSAELSLPLQAYLSVVLDYGKDTYQAYYYTNSPFQGSYSGPGSQESWGAGLVLYAELFPHEKGPDQAYVPQVGLPGRARLRLSYHQANDLKVGEESARLYFGDLTFALPWGVGLNLGVNVADDVTDPWKDFKGVVKAQDDHTQTSLHVGVSYAWGRT